MAKPTGTVESEPEQLAIAIDGAPILDDDATTSGDNDPADTINGYDAVDPDTGAGKRNNGSRAGGRRRGRPPGSGAGATKKEKISGSVNALEALLLSIHQMGAALLETPELELNDKEAKSLAVAASNVAAHYDTALNPRLAVWGQLCIVLATIYGTRIWAIRTRKQMTKVAAPAAAGNVVDFKTAGKKAAPAADTLGGAKTPADLFPFGYQFEAAMAE